MILSITTDQVSGQAMGGTGMVGKGVQGCMYVGVVMAIWEWLILE